MRTGQRYLFILICLLTCSAAVQAVETEPVPADPHEKAAYDIRNGKMDEAIDIYRTLVRADPKNIERRKELMWALWHANKTDETAAEAITLMRMTPKDVEVINLLARAQSMMGQKQAALWTYQKSLGVNPEQVSVKLAIVRLHIDLKDFTTASNQLIHLQERYPKEPLVYANMAQIAFLKGSYEESRPLWAKAITLAPDNILFKVHEAETLYRLGKMSEAHEKLKTIVAESKNAWPDKDRREIWALLQTVPGLPGEKIEPLKPYEHPLGVDEVQIGLALGRLYSDLRDYEAASEILLDLEKTHKDNPEIYARLAKQYFLRNMFAEAADAYGKASNLSPTDVTLQFEEARCLYYSGDRKTARKKLQDVALRQSNSKWRAIDFLTDVALINNDLSSAQDYLEGNLSDLHKPDEPRYLRLAGIYIERGQITKALATIDSFVAQNPHDGRALLFKGDILVQHGRVPEAIDIYKKVIELNPVTVRAYFSLADAYNVMQNPREALANIRKARAIDPTDPYLEIWEARYRYDVGDVDGSTRQLNKILAETKKPLLPAVLYHGVSAIPQDPLLAYSVHTTTAAFEDHMRAIAEAGYTPVTASQVDAWVHGRAELPAKPIMIAFDDARLDGMRNGDAILEKYHLKATMFVPLVNVDRNLPGYASWDQLVAFQKTGRWEMQSHGDIAHIRIPIDPEGRSGLYLVNLQWLGTENRYETENEWRQRVINDHASAKKKMAEHLGTTPVALAYPEGDFGQLGLPSSSKAVEINIAESRKAWGSAYHQDNYGINVQSRDPQLLTRNEPPKELSGEDLVKGFAEKSPLNFARITLLRQATWQGNIHTAMRHLADLKQDTDMPPKVILAQDAQIHYAARDLNRAQELVNQAAAFGDTSDLQSLRNAIDLQKRFIWSPSFLYQEDNRTRKNWLFHQTLSSWAWGDARWTLHQMTGSYQEQGTPDVTQNGVGVGTSIRAGLFHTLDAQILGQFLSGESNRTTYSASGGLRSQWTDEWATHVEGGRALYDTAQALNAGIAERYGRLSATWIQQGPWEMKTQGKFGDLNDGNQLYDGQFDLTRRLFAESNVRLGYHFETEHMQDVKPEYYSPQHLIVHQAVLQLSTLVPPGFYFNLRYLPGYGKEDNVKGEFINDVELSLPIPVGKQTMLTPEIWLSRTPTYRRDSYSVSLTHRF